MPSEQRRALRYSAQLEGTLVLPDRGAMLAVVIEDLCVLGCLLGYAPSLQVHQECELRVDWEGRTFQSPAQVAWASQRGQAGLAFHKTDAANQRLLREMCAALRQKPLAPLPKDPD